MSQQQLALKKKYFGEYYGEIPSYSFQTETDIIEVEAASIHISISSDEVKFEIGSLSHQGTYKVLFEANNYFLLDCVVPNQLASERIMVYKKGKKIARDGLYPQPITFLFKKK
jgi:hypothetical protein